MIDETFVSGPMFTLIGFLGRYMQNLLVPNSQYSLLEYLYVPQKKYNHFLQPIFRDRQESVPGLLGKYSFTVGDFVDEGGYN